MAQATAAQRTLQTSSSKMADIVARLQPALDALLSSYSGNTAPEAPVAGLIWLDTSATPNIMRIYDGSNWQALVDYASQRATAVASAATVSINGLRGDFVHITGTTTITSFGAGVAGNERVIVFDGALTLTNNANILLPGGTSVQTAAGDCAIFRSEGGNIWRCINYTAADQTRGWKLISTNTISTAVAAIDIALPAGFDLFQIELTGLRGSVDAAVSSRLSLDGSTFIATSVYNQGTINNTSSGVAGGAAAGTEAVLTPTTVQFSAGGPAAAVSIRLDPGGADTVAHMTAVSTTYPSGGARGAVVGTYFASAGRVQAIRIYPTAGNLTKGKIILTGLKS